ncbi:MAG TPA: DNA translocase FtsK, partial [Anaerolineae bacterium]|nr:DNA translocase FtsK [Anaerolineae bacterium]
MGAELLEETQLDAYLTRLEKAEFDDNSPHGGPSPAEKSELLRRFLTQVLTDRDEVLQVLQLDWREVAPILHKSRRKTRAEQLQELATALEAALEAQRLEQDALPEPVRDVLQDLTDGQEPETEGLDSLLGEYGDALPRSLRNKLRRLRGVRKHQDTDFIAGITHLATELLSSLRGELPEGAALQVRFDERTLDRVGLKEAEALLSFRTLYGGVEEMMPHVRWGLGVLWDLAQQHADLVGEEEEDEEGEREKVVKVNLLFRVGVVDGGGNEIAYADLTWHYRSDGPAAATLAHLRSEAQRLSAQDTGGPLFKDVPLRLPVPIYNTCPPPEEIGDLDLSRPVASLGVWYRRVTDLGAALREELAPRARPEAWNAVERALVRLEEAWARFVGKAAKQGALAADLDELLTAYEGLLQAGTEHLRQGQEVLHGFRLLTQAWIVGPETFDEWAVVPFLHPFKLHWWRERARRFDTFIARLLDASGEATIVDERRFRQELNTTYGSAGYPALLALPGRDRRPDYFLPVHEVEGYELFRWVGQAGIAYGLDPDLVFAEESERAAEVAARELARVVQDYIETYPFVRDGLEVYLVQCRNGALPGLLVERLNRLAHRRRWDLHLNVIVHSTDRGAPLYRRVIEWLKAHEEFAARPPSAYFPSVTLKVLECGYEGLFQQVGDTDLVILPDVLAEKGQTVEAEIEEHSSGAESVSLTGYLPVYRVQQAPFERGEFTRDILLTPFPQPALVQRFYNLQWAARERQAVPAEGAVRFRLRVSLQDWERELAELHRRFNWVTCYDTTVDRFLLEDTFPNTVELIRYSLGLGVKRRHNLTVSSSRRAREIVERRLTASLETLLPGTSEDFRHKVAQRLVEEAKQVSGDIVLRAAGPGAYLNELIGIVVAKYQVEQRYRAAHPDALTAWIYLDDFAHWFDRRVPDLLFVAIPPKADGELPLHIEVIETKCIGETHFAAEAADAQRQVAQGVNRLAKAWAPGGTHLDAPYWYDQLYRAVVGNLAVHRDQMRLWEAFRHRLPRGDFTLEMSGHTWVFCYEGSAGVLGLSDEGEATVIAPDARDVPHRYHHFGRAGLRRLLRDLVEEKWGLEAPSETWSSAYDQPLPTSETLEPEPVARPEGLVLTESVPEPSLTLPTRDPMAEWCDVKARELARVLRDYDIRVYPIKPDEADVGPSVVRFKVRLRPGEKIGRLQNIAADLQRELALEAIPLIENVRGTRYVGIDLPRPEREIVPLRPALAELPQAPVGHLPFLVGKTPDGRTVTTDLTDLTHLLVAGSTGSGKTVFLYTLILSLTYQFGPEALSLLLIDPKQTDFVYFEGLPHLMGGRVVIEAEEAIAWLDQLTTETLGNRTQQLRRARCRDIRDYNERLPDAPMPPIVVIVDEYADLVQVLDRHHRQEFERRLVRLAQRARNVGIHLVIATQRPSADIVTTSLKANLPARIAFRLPSHHDSMTVLDQAGAENLLGKGDMLFLAHGQVERLQAFYIAPAELDRWRLNSRNTPGSPISWTKGWRLAWPGAGGVVGPPDGSDGGWPGWPPGGGGS